MAKSISLGYTSISGNTSINTIQPQTFQPTKHTTSANSNICSITFSSFSSICHPKHTYHLLGEDITVESIHDRARVAQTIALINCIGWSYYEEIKKQGVEFIDEMKTILEPRYKSYLRNKSITNILD
jgi:hypothetical protein